MAVASAAPLTPKIDKQYIETDIGDSHANENID